MATTRVFYDDKSGNIIDSLGSVVGNVKSDLPSNNSIILKSLGKIFDFFELDDDKIFNFIKRNTIGRFFKKGNNFDDLENELENYSASQLAGISVEDFQTRMLRKEKNLSNAYELKIMELEKKIETLGSKNGGVNV